MRTTALCLLLSSALAVSCGGRGAPENPDTRATVGGEKPKTGAAGPTVEEARAFVERTDRELRELWIAQAEAEWDKSTNITDENEARAAAAAAASMSYLTEAIRASRRFDPITSRLPADVARQLLMLRLAGTPAPSDAAAARELAELSARMESIYGKWKYCDQKGRCRDLTKLEEVMTSSRKPPELLDAWSGWHTVGREIGPLYRRFVELANAGAREVGFADTGARWRAGYDMSPEAFAAETERLFQEVRPLYDQLHCYVRRKLSTKYGARTVPGDGPIPAHLLGNMWAQSWSNIYALMEPHKGQVSPDVTPALRTQRYTPERMVKLAEGFFTSLGLDPLPQTFWERSMFVKPKDRDVVCHASAWDLTFSGDVRIKMCIKIDQDDLITIHHELGHNYYYLYYRMLPVLFQGGAHDGFHEAIGDAIALSITPSYLKQIGLLKAVKENEKATINQQMFLALDKIAFLPWGLLVDRWRWDVFAGKVAPEEYNQHWWALRRQYQGVAPAVERAAEDFDPGAKYHIPANVPYMRYFLSFILQFQFHRALCQAAGHEGPLHTCSIYGSKEAGERLKAMLSMGASRPWPEAMKALTGEERMSGDAIIEYFAPLISWLEKQNQGQPCGW